LDARSDLYSLGVLGYRMLTGQLPFLGPNARDYLLQHVSSAPTPLLELAPQVASSPDLGAAVMRALAKDPKARPQSAAEWVRSLEGPHAGRVPTPLTQVAASPHAAEAPDAHTQPALRAVGQETATQYEAARDWRSYALRGAAALAALGVLVAIVLWSLGPRQALSRARAELLTGHPEEALHSLTASSGGALSAGGQALRAAALHALKDHDQELLALQAGQRSDEAFDPLVLSAVSEDLAHGRGEAARKQWLDGLEPVRLTAALESLAASTNSEGAWGALRYLDTSGRLDAHALSLLYAGWLEQKDCAARALAARRLGELGATEELAALQRARKKAKPGCGLEEMTSAVRQLEAHAAGH